MTYEELKEINYGNPSRELLTKALLEWDGMITFYRKQSIETKDPSWKGHLGNKVKEHNRLQKLLEAKEE